MSSIASIASAHPPRTAPGHPELEALRRQHQRAVRLIELLHDITGGMTRLSGGDVGIVRDIFRYLVTFVDTEHHAREDIIVDALLAKDPALQAVLEPYERTHRRIARKGTALLRRLGERGRADPRHLLGHILQYTTLLIEHFDAEEASLFPLAAERLDEADWAAIQDSLVRLEDPLFGAEVGGVYTALFDYYVNYVREVGRAPGRLHPHAAAALIDGAGAILDGVRETIAAARFGTRQLLAANASGAAQIARSRNRTQAATALREWAQESRKNAVIALRLVGAAAGQARRSTIEPLGARNMGKRQFANAFRLDDTRPSWQANVANLMLRAFVKRTLSKGEIDNLRGGAPTVERLVPHLPADVLVTHVELDNAYAEIFEVNGQAPGRTILHLPGGGFLFPATQIHRLMAARLARIARARVMLVHYRLAPEHPYPAGLDDCVDAYHYLLDQGVAPARITICGDSAGGGLTLSTLLRLREAGVPMPSSAVLLSPLADLTNTGASRDQNRWHDPMLPLDRKNNLADLYLRGVPTDDPFVSPIFADLSGLPPLLIQVGSTEILLDDALRVAARVRATGGSCETEVWHEMPHVWMLIGLLPEAVRACQRIARFIDATELPTSAMFDVIA